MSVLPTPPVLRNARLTAILMVILIRPYKEDILVIAKAVTMLGESVHQSPDDLDTVEQPGELDNLVL